VKRVPSSNKECNGTLVGVVHNEQQDRSDSACYNPTGNVKVTPNITPMLMPEIESEPDNI